MCSLEQSLSLCSRDFYFWLCLSLCYLDLDFSFCLDFDFWWVSFFDRYCLLNESVFWELEWLSWDFFVFSLLELTILPSQLIKARLSEKLIFFIICEILLFV
jgi:hypothetical protein